MKNSIKSILFLSLVTALVVLAACTSDSGTRNQSAPAAPAASPAFLSSKSMPAGTTYSSDANGAGGSGEAAPEDRKIVRTGSITMEVSDIGKSQSDITDIAGQYKG